MARPRRKYCSKSGGPMDSSEIRPPCRCFRESATSRAFMSGLLISDRALPRSRVRVSGLMVTSSDFGTTFRQTMLCGSRILSFSTSLLVQSLDELRQHLEDIVGDAVVGDFEDRRFRVGVNGDDGLALLDAHRKLHGAAGAADEGQFRTGYGSRLPHHAVVAYPALVDSNAGGADVCLERSGKPAQQGEVTLYATTADDEALRLSDVRTAARRPPDHSNAQIVLGDLDRDALDRAGPGRVEDRPGKHARPHSGHLGPSARTLDGSENTLAKAGHLAGENSALLVDKQVGAVRRKASTQPNG